VVILSLYTKRMCSVHTAQFYNLKISFWRKIMKKHLLMTTAMVAAGALAVSSAALAKPKLSVGGYAKQIVGIGENDKAFDAANGQRVGLDQLSDGEVHFNGSVKLDNGIKIRTQVQIESNNETSQADEHWMRISGGFGEIRLGAHDAGAMAMTTGYLGSFSTGVGENTAFDAPEWVNRPATVSAATVNRVDVNGDAESISYFTPRMSGFQLGGSYTPGGAANGNGSRELRSTDTEGFTVGINYNTKMGGASVGVAAGYGTKDESTVFVTDEELWMVGGHVTMQGFRIGLSYHDRKGQTNDVTNATVSRGQETVEIGVRYSFGPNAVGINHISAETQGSQASGLNGDKTDVTSIAYRRTLGPGVAFRMTAFFADYDDGATAAADGASNKGEAILTSIQVSF
jgi:hypothetical protein